MRGDALFRGTVFGGVAMLGVAAMALFATQKVDAQDQRRAAPTVDPQFVTAEAYADCLAKWHYRELGRVLESGMDAAFDTALAKISGDKCDRSAVSLPPASLRGFLFAALYRRFGPQAGRAASNLTDHWMPALPSSDPRYPYYYLSACIVGKEPDATRAFVRARVGTGAAARQMPAIIASLPKCLPGGQQIRVNLPTLTGYLAETVYQIDFAVEPGEHNWSN